VAVDLDIQTGLKSPPTKRPKLSGFPDNDEPSPTKEWVTEDEDGEDGSQSPDSLILDLFHAEDSGEPLGGIYSLFRLLMKMISRSRQTKLRP